MTCSPCGLDHDMMLLQDFGLQHGCTHIPRFLLFLNGVSQCKCRCSTSPETNCFLLSWYVRVLYVFLGSPTKHLSYVSCCFICFSYFFLTWLYAFRQLLSSMSFRWHFGDFQDLLRLHPRVPEESRTRRNTLNLGSGIRFQAWNPEIWHCNAMLSGCLGPRTAPHSELFLPRAGSKRRRPKEEHFGSEDLLRVIDIKDTRPWGSVSFCFQSIFWNNQYHARSISVNKSSF